MKDRHAWEVVQHRNCENRFDFFQAPINFSSIFYFVLFSLVSFYFVFISLISFRFVFVDFVSFRFVSFLFRFGTLQVPRFAALVIIFSISTPCNYPIVVWSCGQIGYDDTVRDAWSSGVLMSVGVITVGVMSVGEIIVRVMTVGVMRRPQISMILRHLPNSSASQLPQ